MTTTASSPPGVAKQACDHCGSGVVGAGAGAEDAPVRCPCGALVAVRVPEGIQLKCRRCRRTLLVPFELPEASEAG